MTRLLAELPGPTELVAAIEAMRLAGVGRLEAYMPYPVHEVEAALSARPSRLPWAIAAFGFAGAAGGYGLQWLLNAWSYPIDVGGRPPHYPLAYVPITFEMGVLAAAFAAFVGVLVLGRLLRLWHPVFEADGFTSASRDGFWLEVYTEEPDLDVTRTTLLLRQHGARLVQAIEEGRR